MHYGYRWYGLSQTSRVNPFGIHCRCHSIEIYRTVSLSSEFPKRTETSAKVYFDDRFARSERDVVKKVEE
jgi:hypothetical protein